MIKMKDISFAYGKKQVLKDISLTFETGKLYAIIGPNGSGKTTFIHLLARLAKANSGKLWLDGELYEHIDRKAFAKQVAMLPQDRNIPDMTVYDLVACGRFPHLDLSRKLSAEDVRAVRAALHATGAADFLEKAVKQLSGGERQKAYIAMLLAQNSPCILLDEPTTHLDISAKFDIMKLLCEIRNNDKCVIAILHDLDLALQYADEIILMKEGSVLCHEIPQKIMESGNLERVFGVKCESVTQNGQRIYYFCDK